MCVCVCTVSVCSDSILFIIELVFFLNVNLNVYLFTEWIAETCSLSTENYSVTLLNFSEDKVKYCLVPASQMCRSVAFLFM